MIWWLAAFVLLTLTFRVLIAIWTPPPAATVAVQLPLPETVGDFLTYPLPLMAKDVAVTEDGGPCDVYNHAAALVRLRHVRLP